MEEQSIVLLSQLADKLGVATDVLWQTLITQARVDMWKGIFAWGVSLVIFVGLCVLNWNLFAEDEASEKEGKRRKNEGTVIILSIIIAVFGVCLFISGLSGMGNILTVIYNPEYWALNKLSHLFVK